MEDTHRTDDGDELDCRAKAIVVNPVHDRGGEAEIDTELSREVHAPER